jgi:uncharacterized protein YvpB
VSTRANRRRGPQLFPWLAAAIAAVVLSSCVALAAWTYMQEDDMKDLRASLEVQQQARSTSEAQLVALQSTATALEARLAQLEAGTQPQGSAAPGSTTEDGDSLQRIDDLEAAVAELQVKLGELGSAVNEGLKATDSQAPAIAEPATSGEVAQPTPSATRLSVARQQQSHNLSCESSAASMVAEYYGVPLSEEEVLALLPFNSNPCLGFRGNVDGPTGGIVDYGVYAGPIADILNARGLQARMVSGGLEGIKAAITEGNPVIAWVTYNCLPSTRTTTLIDGQEVTLVPNQHVVVVTGFNADGVWANDPWDGQEDYYSTSDFVRAMSYFGDMAIEVAGP